MLFLALRHLLSRKRQTLIILFGISLGTMVYVTIAGIQLGFREFIVAKLINNNAHVKISGREELITPENITPQFFQPSEVISWIIPPYGNRDEAHVLYPQGWFSRLDDDSEVMAYAPQFQAQAIFRNGGVSRSGQLIGIQVDRQLRVTNIEEDVIQGKFQAVGTSGNRVVLGSVLAQKIGTLLNSTVFISTGTNKSQPFRVVGLFKTGVQQIDESIAYGALSDVQQLGGTPGRISAIAVKLYDIERSKPLADHWSMASTDKVQGWQEANASFLQIFKIQDFMRLFITSTVLMVAAFGIYNVLTIIISQKKKEIAILRALGFSPKEIEILFLMQGAILGTSGAVIGLCLGFCICTLISGLKLDAAGFDKFHVSFQPSIYVIGLSLAVIAALAAGFFPARQARNMTPVDIIRSDG